MAVSTGKKVAFAIILIAAYFIGKGNEEHKKYDDLKSKPQSELTQDDRDFIRKTEDERAEAEADRISYQLEQKKKDEADKPRRELMELQIAVRVACEDTAKSQLKYPGSYSSEQHEDGIEKENNSYYYTLHYSGVNAFNVRSTHTIECYGTLGDKSHNVTYRTFN